MRQATGDHGQRLSTLADQIQRLTLAKTLSHPATPSNMVPLLSPDAPEPHVWTLERYNRDPETCSPLITNCTLLFCLKPHTFLFELFNVGFTINHLTSWAHLRGTAKWERQFLAFVNFQTLAAELQKVFGLEAARFETACGLLNLRQGQRSRHPS